MDIDVHIDRLVLDGMGVDIRTAAQIAAVVETELARRLAEGAMKASTGPAAVPLLRPAPVEMPEGAGPHVMGRGIAGAVMGGLGHG